MTRKLMSVLAIASFCSSLAIADDNAGIFFYGPAPSPEQISELAAGANVTTATKGDKISLIVKWPDVALRINIDPAWERSAQLSGIRGWLGQFSESERNSMLFSSFIGALDRTTTCYGSVISPGYDQGGKVVALLKKLLGPSGGFFFSHQSFYNSRGARIIGLDGDPALLGPK